MADFLPWLIPLAVLVVGLGGLFGLRLFLRTKAIPRVLGRRWSSQLILLGLTAVLVIVVILVLPISEGTREQLLSLLGIVLTAAIALSSTTFLGNALAGLMLRAVKNYRPGDFLRVGDHFGRVSEQGLLHTEIQTEDGDLTTLPNLYVITNPVTVVREKGTIVSATVSLGYDIHHSTIDRCLLEAAASAKLAEPFVQVLELGDFSVTYRVAGFLEDVPKLVSRRSHLRRAMLDSLHGAGIEIVSPTFMNQRAQPADRTLIPKPTRAAMPPAPEGAAEAIMFDKAEAAAEAQQVVEELEAVERSIAALRGRIGKADDAGRPALEAELAVLEEQRDLLRSEVAAVEQSADRDVTAAQSDR